MIQALWAILGVIGLGVGLGVLFTGMWRRNRRMLSAHSLDDEQVDVLLRRARDMGLRRAYRRELFGARLFAASGEVNGNEAELELCDSGHFPYTRVEVRFQKPLDQGLRIQTEEEAGLLGWVLRFREVELGTAELDDAFILLAREEERLRELMEAGLDERLIKLQDVEEVTRVSLTDEVFFVFCSGVLGVEHLTDLLSRIFSIVVWLTREAEERGAIESLTARSYEDAIGQLFNREDSEEEEGLDHSSERATGSFRALTASGTGYLALTASGRILRDGEEISIEEAAAEAALDLSGGEGTTRGDAAETGDTAGEGADLDADADPDADANAASLETAPEPDPGGAGRPRRAKLPVPPTQRPDMERDAERDAERAGKE